MAGRESANHFPGHAPAVSPAGAKHGEAAYEARSRRRRAMTRRLATVALLVRDYEEALAFYVGVPGSGGADILLARAADETQAQMIGRQGGGRVWLFLHTDELIRDHARMSGLGVRFTDGPRAEAYGKVAVFEDLYGNRWDLIEPAPKV